MAIYKYIGNEHAMVMMKQSTVRAMMKSELFDECVSRRDWFVEVMDEVISLGIRELECRKRMEEEENERARKELLGQ